MEEQKQKEYFKFDDADLQINRTGQFSERQIAALKQAQREFGSGMRWTAIPFLLSAVLGIVSAILGRSLGWGWILIWGVGWTLIWGLIGWGFVEGSFTKGKLRFAKVQGRIKIASKEGVFNFKLRKASIWSDLLVGKQRFEVKTDLNQLFTRGDEYIVYYEKGSKSIVSLEFVSAAERFAQDADRLRNVDVEEEAKKLHRHFEFTEADLMANQRGTLSDKQVKRIAKEEKGGRVFGVLIGIFLLIFPVLFMPMTIASFKDITPMQEYWGVMVFFASVNVIFGLILLGLGAAGIFLIVSQFIGKADYALQQVRGRANLIKGYSDRRSHVYYDLNVDGIQFDGDGSMNKAIIQDAEYVVYYLDKVYRVMSIELVGVD